MVDRDTKGGGNYADDLTWREQEVLGFLSERLTNREIADQLHLAESTVKDYVSSILSKLYVKNRREAVEKAKELDLLGRSQDRSLDRRSNLPPDKTRFIGREAELSQIRQELSETRLLSLIGPGGIGKTRLALKVAETLLDDFPDGVFFVGLAPLRSSTGIIQAISESLRIPIATQEAPRDQLIRFLRNKEILLVMDNFEHLLPGTEFLGELLQGAENVKLLATSRERLNLQSESIFQVGGLTFPSAADAYETHEFDAVALFIQRASKVRPGFAPTPKEMVLIGKICQRVGGMPLAIELSAAWLQLLNVYEVAAELEKNLDLLATDVRDTPERHRSIRTVFDSSWSMLDPSEQGLFSCLSVFRGGFTRKAAQQVTGATLAQLAGLADKSLINFDPATGRLEVHELLRQFAQEKLEDVPDICHATLTAHANYYADFMEQAWEDLRSARQYEMLAQIDADIDNVRTAWHFYLDRKDVAQLWRMIYSLWYLYWIRWWNQPGEAFFAEAAQALEGGSDPESIRLQTQAVVFQAFFMSWLGVWEQGYALAKKCIETLEPLGDLTILVYAIRSLEINAYMLHRYGEFIDLNDRITKTASLTGDRWLVAYAQFGKGLGAIVQDDFQQAEQLAKTTLAFYEEIGDEISSTLPLIVLGHAAYGLGDYSKARNYYYRCLKISRRVDFYYSIQTASKYLSKVCLEIGELKEAQESLVQSLAITKDIGFIRDIVNLVYEFARLMTARKQYENAAELLALVIQHPVSQHYRMLEGRIRDNARDLLSELQVYLTPEQFSAAVERGQQLELDSVVASLLSKRDVFLPSE